MKTTIQLDNGDGRPIRIKFDPSQLRLKDIEPGMKDIRNDIGEASVVVESGTGVVLNFVAVGRGSSVVTVVGPSSMVRPELAVTIR